MHSLTSRYKIMDLVKELSEKELREIIANNELDYRKWDAISWNQKLSEDFIREFHESVNWSYISYSQVLSEDFIREFKDKVRWTEIAYKQVLSEDFIREFQKVVLWADISQYQKLSEDFIREFKELVSWSIISQYQVLSDEFIEEFKDLLDLDELCINSVHHCGKNNRTIRIKKSNPSIIHIGCFEGTKEEVIQAVQEKYGLDSEYEKQIIECFNF